MSSLPPPIRLPATEGPDRNFDTLRLEALEVVQALSGDSWTDYNLPGPGVTFLEAGAWGGADLHYRTSTRRPRGWPFEAPGWLSSTDRRPWSGGMPLSVAGLEGMADALSQAGSSSDTTRADELVAFATRAEGFTHAIGWVQDQGWGLDVEQAAAAVRLARLRGVRRVATDKSHEIRKAVEEAERTVGATPADPAVLARARTILEYDDTVGALWDEEVSALLGREVRRRLLDRVQGLTERIRDRGATRLDADDLRAELTAVDGLSSDEAAQATALMASPTGLAPEFWEVAPTAPSESDPPPGGTRVWPPHPVQALSCEPVTAEDYAALARGVEGVGRAWAVPGVLEGIGWDGRTVPADESDVRPGTVTLLLEKLSEEDESEAAFLRRVLREALSHEGDDPEVDLPHADMHDDRVDPRRLLCDEVGAAVLDRCPVVLQGTIHSRVGVDRAEVIQGALDRVAGFFADGRPESQAGTETTPDFDGPWPPAPQPVGGWIPGDPIRITELVQVVLADPAALGIESLQVSVSGGPFLPTNPENVAADIPLSQRCIPVLAENQCLRVRLGLGAEC